MDFLHSVFDRSLELILGFNRDIYFVAWTSLKVSVWAVLLAVIFGLPGGLLIALTRFRGRSTLLLILNTLMALPTVVIGLIWFFILSRMGPLGNLGLLFSPTGMILGLFILALPIVINLTIAALERMDTRLALTVKLMGATPAQQAMKILSEARYAIGAAIVLAFGRVISEVGIAMMLGGNIKGLTRTMTTAIALETGKGEFELGLALGVFLLAIALMVNAVLFFFQRRA